MSWIDSGRDAALEQKRREKEALLLLGLIERHRWEVWPSTIGDGPWFIQGRHLHRHDAPTLIEALTEAANCDRCCGRG